MNWLNTYTGTGQMPLAANVNVAPVTDSLGNVGIRFTGGFTDAPDAGIQQASDAVITYKVSSLTGLLSGVRLAGDPLVAGGTGVMSVTETFQAGIAPPQQIDIHSVVNPGVNDLKLYDSATFSPTQSIEVVNKGILAYNGGGFPTLSYIDQTFAQQAVPEPGSVVLLGIGGVAALGYGWRRRKVAPQGV